MGELGYFKACDQRRHLRDCCAAVWTRGIATCRGKLTIFALVSMHICHKTHHCSCILIETGWVKSKLRTGFTASRLPRVKEGEVSRVDCQHHVHIHITCIFIPDACSWPPHANSSKLTSWNKNIMDSREPHVLEANCSALL